MDLSFIQEQLNLFETVGDAIESIWNAIRELFGSEGTVEGGTLDNLSSYFDDAPADETGAEADGSSFEGSSVDGVENEDEPTEAEGSSFEGSSVEEES